MFLRYKLTIPIFRKALTVACIAILFTLAWLSHAQDFRGDDWSYLNWGRRTQNLMDAITNPPPFPYRRPLNALVWQLQSWFGPAHWGPAQSTLILLWLLNSRRVYQIGKQLNGKLCATLSLFAVLCLSPFRELIEWRSWLTMAGGLFGFLSAWKCLLQRPDSRSFQWFPILWLCFGAGFREDTWYYGILLLISYKHFKSAGVALCILLFQLGLSDLNGSRFALAHILQNLTILAETLTQGPLLALYVLLPICFHHIDWRRFTLFSTFGFLPICVFYLPNPSYLLFSMVLLSIEMARVLSLSIDHRQWGIALGLGIGLSTSFQTAQWDRWETNRHHQKKLQEEVRQVIKHIDVEKLSSTHSEPNDEPSVWLSNYYECFHGITHKSTIQMDAVEIHPHFWVQYKDSDQSE